MLPGAPGTERATEIRPELLHQLRADLVDRRIQNGYGRLDANADVWRLLSPTQANSAEAIGYLAQWVDVGYGSVELVEELLSRFPKRTRARIPALSYMHLRMAEGLVRMSREDADDAIRHFNFVLGFREDIEDQELVAITHFWIARCRRKKGEYEAALTQVLAAREIAEHLGFPRMAGAMKVLESWLNFQQGKARDAHRLLGEAGQALRETDDYVSLGNIESAYGRMLRREGRYDASLSHFRKAIEEYRKRDALHRNLARALANMAYVERMLSLEIKKRIDSEAARPRQPGSRVAPFRERFDQLRQDALTHLRQAGEIYTRNLQHHGAGTAKVNCGYLYLDTGELDRASVEASEAYVLGEQKRDYILMARARLLQCMVENAKLEEGLEERDPGQQARAAQECARDSVEFALKTENRRLLARAYIWQGLTYCNEFFSDAESARESCDKAAALVRPEGHDPLWSDLQALRDKIVRSGSVDATLRAWSQGVVGDKSFQQIGEEFAELVIPKVWEQEGRKVSRVATRLSISPKKVRRILTRVGLLKR